MAALAICTLLAAHAQDSRNPSFLVGVTNVKNNYAAGKQKATVGSVLGQLTSAVLAGQTTTKLEGYEDEVKAAIVRGITNTYRLDAIDGNLSESEAAKPGSMYVDATIDNISYTQKTTYYESSKRTYTYYMGQISVTLLFKDAKTDKVVISPSFRLSEYDCSWMETAEKAISNALNSLSRNVRSYLDQCYPLRANIVEGAREKKISRRKSISILAITTASMKAFTLVSIWRNRLLERLPKDRSANSRLSRSRDRISASARCRVAVVI